MAVSKNFLDRYGLDKEPYLKENVDRAIQDLFLVIQRLSEENTAAKARVQAKEAALAELRQNEALAKQEMQHLQAKLEESTKASGFYRAENAALMEKLDAMRAQQAAGTSNDEIFGSIAVMAEEMARMSRANEEMHRKVDELADRMDSIIENCTGRQYAYRVPKVPPYEGLAPAEVAPEEIFAAAAEAYGTEEAPQDAAFAVPESDSRLAEPTAAEDDGIPLEYAPAADEALEDTLEAEVPSGIRAGEAPAPEPDPEFEVEITEIPEEEPEAAVTESELPEGTEEPVMQELDICLPDLGEDPEPAAQEVSDEEPAAEQPAPAEEPAPVAEPAPEEPAEAPEEKPGEAAFHIAEIADRLRKQTAEQPAEPAAPAPEPEKKHSAPAEDSVYASLRSRLDSIRNNSKFKK